MFEVDGIGMFTLEHPTARHLVVLRTDYGRTDWISHRSRETSNQPIIQYPGEINMLAGCVNLNICFSYHVEWWWFSSLDKASVLVSMVSILSYWPRVQFHIRALPIKILVFWKYWYDLVNKVFPFYWGETILGFISQYSSSFNSSKRYSPLRGMPSLGVGV
jgi:hypothetical protein